MDFKVPTIPSVPIAKSESIAGESTSAPAKDTPSSGCPYKVPKWSQPPDSKQNYTFEVLKSGQIIDEVQHLEKKAIWTFGRLPDNDVIMAHPTISRYHAVLQYKPKVAYSAESAEEDEDAEKSTKEDQLEGWYIYDLGSTHGTFLNKQRIPPRVFIRIRVGHMLKMGSSTRVYILQGPGADEEPESELSVTELREQRDQQVAAALAEKERKALEAEERERNEGASWGMREDADEESDLTHNPYANTNNEDLFFDDPKRTLRGFFEREGLNLEYKCDELSQASFVCRVELPIDDSNGRPIVVEVSHKGRKKDCVVQCALEACRTLDRHGVLRQANQESQKRKNIKSGDSDDEDEFWDRTGDVARKRQRKANIGSNVTLTYEDLMKQESDLEAELLNIEKEINAYQQNDKRLKELAVKQQGACDDLDNFMDSLTENVTQVDKTEIKKLRLEQQRIKCEQQKVHRLIKIAKPTALPFSVSPNMSSLYKNSETVSVKKQSPMIGKRNQFSKFKVVKALPSPAAKVRTNAFASEIEEFEDEDDDVDEGKQDTQNQTERVGKEDGSGDLQEISTVHKTVKTSELTKGVQQSYPAEECEDSANKGDVQQIEKTTEVAVAAANVSTSIHTETAVQNAEDKTADDAAQKKRRQRARQRSGKQRQDVDMDQDDLAEHEDSEKYAKWVPPTNQSGDGITHLNDKFGY